MPTIAEQQFEQSGQGEEPGPEWRLSWPIILLALLIIGYTAFFTTQLILHYYSFGSRALDLGNMDQTMWNTLQGRWFHQTNQPGANNRLSLHVEPIFLPLSLLYLIYSGPEILFLFQSFVVALGAIPVYALARFKLRSELLALTFALIFLMFPAIQGATLLDFHPVTLAPTFLLAAFYFMETKRPGWFALFAILAVSTKEDMTLLVLMLGLYALLINRQIRLGLTTIGLCLVWAFLAVFVIPPTFADTPNIHWNRYDHLGDSPTDIVLNFVIEPQRALTHLRQVDALGYLRQLLTPTAFTALLNPHTLLLALPSFGINLLSNFPPMQRVNSLIYAAPTVPAVMISSIYGLARLQRFGAWLVKRWPGDAEAQRRKLANLPTFQPSNLPTLQTLLLTLLLLTATLLYHAAYGYLPGGGQYRGWEEVTPHHRRAEIIFDQIPAEAKLSAQDRLNPHVSQRETLYIFDRIADADHIVLDVTEDSWPLHPVELRHRVDDFLANEFGVVDALDGYILLAKQPDLPRTLPDAFYDFARVDPASFAPQHPTHIEFAGKLRLLGYDLGLGAHEAFLPVVTLYWQALTPLEEDYTVWPFFIDHNGHPIADPGQLPPVTPIWYPTSAWSPAEIIAVRTLPQDLGDQFTLALGVSRGDWADPARRLKITKIEGDRYTFEDETWVRLDTFQRTGRKSYEAVSPPPEIPMQPYEVQFWDLIELRAAALPANVEAGEDLHFSLAWETRAPLTVDLTTFAHLLDTDGQAVAQLDWGPQDRLGYLPTTAWQPDRLVVDQQSLPLPADLPPGDYHLLIGWYYAPTGDRLPLTKGGQGDALPLGVVRVE